MAAGHANRLRRQVIVGPRRAPLWEMRKSGDDPVNNAVELSWKPLLLKYLPFDRAIKVLIRT